MSTLINCLMFQDDISKKNKEVFIQPALNCGVLMSSMISDILDFTKAKMTIFEMKYASVNIRKLIGDIVQIM